MQTWEIIAAYRHAYQIMSFRPNAQLARALANFMGSAQAELERRDAWAAGTRQERRDPRRWCSVAHQDRAARRRWPHERGVQHTTRQSHNVAFRG